MSVTAPAAPTLRPVKATFVAATVESTGRHASTREMFLHEVPLARRRLEADGENLIVHNEWPDWCPSRTVERSVAEEAARLMHVANYGPALFEEVYGKLHTGRFREIVQKMAQAFAAGVPPKQIVDLGRADGELMEIVEADIQQEPHGPLTMRVVAPTPAPTVDAGEMAKLAGDLDAAPVNEPAPLNGTLMEKVQEAGFNEVQARDLAVLVRDHGLELTDAQLSGIRGVVKADARKRLRDLLLAHKAG